MDSKDESYYFESTQLALRSNTDYLKLMEHMGILCSQRIQVHSQIDGLQKLMENSLEVFEKMRKKNLRFSADVEIAKVIYIFF